MKKAGKIISINIGILLGYSLLIKLVDGRDGISIMTFSAFMIVCQVLGNLLIGLTNRSIPEKKATSGSYILSAFVVLVIGFGVCLGNAGI